jgi:hypothetical protein
MDKSGYLDVAIEQDGILYRIRVNPDEELMRDCKAILGIDSREVFTEFLAKWILEEAKKIGLTRIDGVIDWRWRAEKIMALINSKPRSPTLDEVEAALKEVRDAQICPSC